MNRAALSNLKDRGDNDKKVKLSFPLLFLREGGPVKFPNGNFQAGMSVIQRQQSEFNLDEVALGS